MPFRLNKTYGVLLLFGGDAIKAYKNGNAETKDNTVCTVWQKKEGTFNNAEAFYVAQSDYDNITKVYSTFANPNYSGFCRSHTFTLRDDIANIFTIVITGNFADEETDGTTANGAGNNN